MAGCICVSAWLSLYSLPLSFGDSRNCSKILYFLNLTCFYVGAYFMPASKSTSVFAS
jgi:hypothetical protein